MKTYENLPIYLKSKDIQFLVNNLVEFVKDSDLPYADEFDRELLHIKFDEMVSNSHDITDFIAGASEGDRPYDYCMENAVFIKKAAHDLLESAVYIEDMGLKDIDYLDLLYNEVEALRVLFIEWVKSFPLWKYKTEDWGLFSPEGIQIIDLPSLDDDDEDDDDFDNDEDY